MPLEFTDGEGQFRRFRLMNQTPKEAAGDSCAGCAFDVRRHCNEPRHALGADEDCCVYTDMVWKEVGKQLDLFSQS